MLKAQPHVELNLERGEPFEKKPTFHFGKSEIPEPVVPVFGSKKRKPVRRLVR